MPLKLLFSIKFLALLSSSGLGIFSVDAYYGGNSLSYGNILYFGVEILGSDNNALERFGWTFSRKLAYDSANDIITGNSKSEYLLGGDGSDWISGGDGDDILQGSSRTASHSFIDVLTGGNGNNTFILGDKNGSFYKGSGYARITDFVWEADTVIFSLGSETESARIKQTGRLDSLLSVSYMNMHGSSLSDTVIAYKASGDVIAVLEDAKVSLTDLAASTLLASPVPVF